MPGFTWVTLAAAETGSFPLDIVNEALLASLFAATLLAEVCAKQLPGRTFAGRFAYAYWRYALPACAFSGFIYWLLFARATR
jgi:hypothetical protein